MIKKVSVFSLFLILISYQAFASMKPLNSNEMEAVHATGFSHFAIDGDTMRLGFDIHLETYLEADQLKMGYYYRKDLQTRKWDLLADLNGQSKLDSKVLELLNLDLIPGWDSDLDDLRNPQFPKGAPSENPNHLDWDINVQGVKLGESKEEPAVIDGLIFRFVFDDIDSDNRKLEKIIIGTNSFFGFLGADSMERSTGLFNPMDTDPRSNLMSGWLAHILRKPTNPIYLKRDAFLTNFGYTFDKTDHDNGLWLMIANQGEHKGFAEITGYKEDALGFSYTERMEDYKNQL